MTTENNTTAEATAAENAAAPAFQVGAYFGSGVSSVRSQVEITHEMVKIIGADKDPSWIAFREEVLYGDVVSAMTQDLTLKHIRVVVKQREGEEDFIEVQVSKEAVDAYNVFCKEMVGVAGVVIGMLKSIYQVIVLSGIDKASEKFSKILGEHK